MTVADDLATLRRAFTPGSPIYNGGVRIGDVVDRVEAEIARLQRHPDAWSQQAFDQQKARADALAGEVARLRDGLRFYADENHWTQMASWGGRIHDEESEAILDGGKIARALLAEDGAA